MGKLVLAIAVLAAAAGCRRTDVRDFTVSIPSMSDGDRAAIAASLAGYGGIEKSSIRFDMSAKTLSLRYDSMQIAKKNIEFSIAMAGFEANGVTPESVGAKPKGAAGK